MGTKKTKIKERENNVCGVERKIESENKIKWIKILWYKFLVEFTNSREKDSFHECISFETDKQGCVLSFFCILIFLHTTYGPKLKSKHIIEHTYIGGVFQFWIIFDPQNP